MEILLQLQKIKKKSLLKFENYASGVVPIENMNDDYYTIREVKSPDGYILDKDWVIGLTVIKGEYTDNNVKKYGIKAIKLTGGGNWAANGTTIQRDSSEKSTWVKIADDGTVINKNGDFLIVEKNYKLAIEFNENSITITWKNPPISGSYNMKIIKKDETSSDWQEKETTTNGSLSGAKFSVRQLLLGKTWDEIYNENKNSGSNKIDMEKLWENNSSKETTQALPTSQTDWTDIYKNPVQITKDNCSYVDLYRIEETVAPKGYSGNNNIMYLAVQKRKIQMAQNM